MMGWEFRDLEEGNVSWSLLDVNRVTRLLLACSRGLWVTRWPWGHQGQGICVCVLIGVGRNLSTQQRKEVCGLRMF